MILLILDYFLLRENQEMGGGQTVMFTSDPKIIRNEKDKVTQLQLKLQLQLQLRYQLYNFTLVPCFMSESFLYIIIETILNYQYGRNKHSIFFYIKEFFLSYNNFFTDEIYPCNATLKSVCKVNYSGGETDVLCINERQVCMYVCMYAVTVKDINE